MKKKNNVMLWFVSKIRRKNNSLEPGCSKFKVCMLMRYVDILTCCVCRRYDHDFGVAVEKAASTKENSLKVAIKTVFLRTKGNISICM